MSIEWDSLILRGNELKTVGPATENARRANSVRTHSTNSRGAPAERIGLAGAATATVKMSWRYGGVDVVSTLWVSTQHRSLVRVCYVLYFILSQSQQRTTDITNSSHITNNRITSHSNIPLHAWANIDDVCSATSQPSPQRLQYTIK